MPCAAVIPRARTTPSDPQVQRRVAGARDALRWQGACATGRPRRHCARSAIPTTARADRPVARSHRARGARFSGAPCRLRARSVRSTGCRREPPRVVREGVLPSSLDNLARTRQSGQSGAATRFHLGPIVVRSSTTDRRFGGAPSDARGPAPLAGGGRGRYVKRRRVSPPIESRRRWLRVLRAHGRRALRYSWMRLDARRSGMRRLRVLCVRRRRLL